MYTFTKVSLSQERTSVLSSIFHLFHNHPMSKIWKQCWALVRQRRIGNKHCLISTSSHQHQRGRQELRVITTILCGKYHSGRSIGHVEAKQRVARLKSLELQRGKKTRKSLTWKRRFLKPPFPGIRPSDLVIQPLLSFGKQIWKCTWEEHSFWVSRPHLPPLNPLIPFSYSLERDQEEQRILINKIRQWYVNNVPYNIHIS
jgi:hypothetical protein